MNQQEIFNGLWTITKQKHNACKEEVEAIGKEHPTERGALQLKAGIYNVATAAGLLSGTDRAIEFMIKRFNNLISRFSDIATYYNNLSEEEKGIMSVALYPEIFMRANFYYTYSAELAEAQREGDPQKIFKAKLKKEVLDEILTMWRDFRVRNGLFLFALADEESENG